MSGVDVARSAAYEFAGQPTYGRKERNRETWRKRCCYTGESWWDTPRPRCIYHVLAKLGKKKVGRRIRRRDCQVSLGGREKDDS